mgnify:CR=1 FL=1
MATANPTELFETFTTKAIEGLGLWAEANQKVLRQLVDLTTATANESLRVYTELQTGAVRAATKGQEYVTAQAAGLKDAPKDPARVHQATLSGGIEGAHEAFKFLESSTETLTKSAERARQSAEQAAKEIQGTLVTLGSQLKALYTPADSAAA